MPSRTGLRIGSLIRAVQVWRCLCYFPHARLHCFVSRRVSSDPPHAAMHLARCHASTRLQSCHDIRSLITPCGTNIGIHVRQASQANVPAAPIGVTFVEPELASSPLPTLRSQPLLTLCSGSRRPVSPYPFPTPFLIHPPYPPSHFPFPAIHFSYSPLPTPPTSLPPHMFWRSPIPIFHPDLVGESDGCTEVLPDGTSCGRFDKMCASVDSIGTQATEPRAPYAGEWFDYQVTPLQ